MASATVASDITSEDTSSWANTAWLVAIAATIAIVHLLTNSRYGFHRDELQTLSDALHLDWGFVPYPPFTPFVERIALRIFGLSLVGLRVFSVIAQSAAIVVTGLMARELGGGRLAQATAAAAVALAPLSLFEGTEFQYTTFDYLWWVLIAYLVIRLLKSEDPRWCLAIGAFIGLGLQTKYTMAFYIAGLLCGLLLTPARRFFASRWFWTGAALALLMFLPNLIWQVRHDFISLHFLQQIHARDVGEGRAQGFWRLQFTLNASRIAVPLWIAGLIGFLVNRRYRPLAWMYIVPVAFFWLANGRGYYTGAAYPMLIAMGATLGERWLMHWPRLWRCTAAAPYLVALIAWGAYVSTIIVPFAASGPLKVRALENNGDLREEIGWDDLVKTVAAVRDSLVPQQQNDVGVLVGNYGERGAIEVLGRAYGLPAPISGTNSAWLHGYPHTVPSTLIVVGWSRAEAEKTFTSCHWVAHNANSLGVHNEESDDHPDIFVCGGPRTAWPEFWNDFQRFG